MKNLVRILGISTIACLTHQQLALAQDEAEIARLPPHIQEKLRAANLQFTEFARQKPNAPVEAIARFSHDMTLDEVRSKASLWRRAKVVGLRHGTGSYGGGIGVKPGESLGQTMQRYRVEHEKFLESYAQSAEKMMSQLGHKPEMADGVKQHQALGKNMRADFQRRGIRVTAVVLTGRAEDIATVQRENSGLISTLHRRFDKTKQKGRR